MTDVATHPFDDAHPTPLSGDAGQIRGQIVDEHRNGQKYDQLLAAPPIEDQARENKHRVGGRERGAQERRM